MTDAQGLFLAQAQTDFDIFRLFRKDQTIPQCHALHYLQMATELLGKAYAWRKGPTRMTHRAFVEFLGSLSSNKNAQAQLGYKGQTASWRHLLRKSKPLAEQIEDLAPALAGDNPNPEYPWPPDDPTHTPIEFEFPIWKELTEEPHGRQFLNLIANLFAAAKTYI